MDAQILLCSYTFYYKAQTTSANSQCSTSTVYDYSPKLNADYKYSCRYCSSLMTETVLLDKPRKDALGKESKKVKLSLCDRCGWWYLFEGFYGYHGIADCIYESSGIAKHYEVSSLDAPISDLRRYLAHHPNDLAHVHPNKFELLMQDCLKDCFGPCEVIHTGRSGDGGVDLVMVLSDIETYLIQVKRRSDLSAKEGVQVVRSLNGVLFRENKTKGLIITTASGFTRGAKQETIIKTEDKNYTMRLMAFDDVVSMLRLPSMTPYEPWRQAI